MRLFCCRMQIRTLALAALLAAPAACQPPASHPSSDSTMRMDGVRQMVLVTTDSWDAVDATLQRYERASAADAWAPVGGPVRAAVGRTGLAWGTGLHPRTGAGPEKREGDGKAPAGVFRLSSAFGYAPAAEAGVIRMP